MRGGNGTYSDAASYGMYVNGSGGSQWTRTMDQGGAYGGVPGNTIIGAQGQNVTSPSQMPHGDQLSLVQRAGRRRHKKGGFLGSVIQQAIVPFGLVGLNQYYGKRHGNKSRKTRKLYKH